MESEFERAGEPGADDMWEAARQRRRSQLDEESARFSRAAQASSSLLTAIVGFSMALVLLGACIFSWVTGSERLWLFGAMSAGCLFGGVFFFVRYRRETAALEAGDREHPRQGRASGKG